MTPIIDGCCAALLIPHWRRSDNFLQQLMNGHATRTLRFNDACPTAAYSRDKEANLNFVKEA